MHARTLRFVLASCLAGILGCGGSDAFTSPSDPGTLDSGIDASRDAEASTGESGPDVVNDGPGPDAEDAAAGDADDAAEDAPSDVPDGMPEADVVEETCATTWYRDEDGDSYGDTSDHVDACTAPDGYVDVPGDCRDDNAEVHPGQTGWFGTGYPDPNKPQGVSFDYDCNGNEEAEPGAPKAPQCTGLLNCQGAGFEPHAPPRSGPGVDSWCGSNLVTTCTMQGLACTGNTVSSTDHYGCR